MSRLPHLRRLPDLPRMLPCLALAALAGCVDVNTIPVSARPAGLSASQRQLAEMAVAHDLKDPESARFRDEAGYSLSNGDLALCGEVNARNGFGGYVGYTPFYVRLRAGKVMSVQRDFAAAMVCNQLVAGAAKISS